MVLISMKNEVVAVASRSFSQDSELVASLLEQYPNSKFNNTGRLLQGKELVDFLQGSEKAIIALEKIDSEIVDQLHKLKLISKFGVGLDNIDFVALKSRGIRLAWEAGINKRSVAELALHFIIGAIRGSFTAHNDLMNGTWAQFKGKNLTGKKIAILGLGNIGQDLVKLIKGFELEIYAFDINDRSDFAKSNGIKMISSLQEILAIADVVSIHLPHTSKTHYLLNKEMFKKFKDGAYLINTARGGIVDESALLDSLNSGKIASAAFDVFENEPLITSALLKHRNFYATSHIGGSSKESITLMGQAAISGLSRGKVAEPRNFFDYEL